MIINSIVDIFLLFGISIGVFISSALLFRKKENNKANKVLAFILLLAVIMLMGRLLFIRYFEDILLFRIGTSVDGTVFLFGPLVLYFLNLLLFKQTPSKHIPLWYFIPAIPYFSYALWTFTLDIDIYYNKAISGGFNRFYFFIEILGILTNSFFVIMSYRLMLSYRKTAKAYLSFDQNIVKFSFYFISAYALSILLWIVSFINTYIIRDYSTVLNYDTIWISIPIFIYVIGFYNLTQPEIFRLNMKPKVKTNNDDRLSQNKIDAMKLMLIDLLDNQKLYHDSNLSLGDLAAQVNVSTNDLSWFINNVYNTTFYEYINRYRIEEFIDRIKNGDSKKHTISAISLDVGFNSKSTFYKAFKLITNTTPGAYIKENNINT